MSEVLADKVLVRKKTNFNANGQIHVTPLTQHLNSLPLYNVGSNKQ